MDRGKSQRADQSLTRGGGTVAPGTGTRSVLPEQDGSLPVPVPTKLKCEPRSALYTQGIANQLSLGLSFLVSELKPTRPWHRVPVRIQLKKRMWVQVPGPWLFLLLRPLYEELLPRASFHGMGVL